MAWIEAAAQRPKKLVLVAVVPLLVLGAAALVFAARGGAPALLSGSGADPASVSAPVAEPDGSDPFFCYVEVLTADRPSVYGYIAARGCVPSGEFRRGERVVFRFQILNTRTGSFVTDKEAALVKMHLSTGEEAPGEFKQRGEGRVADAPWTWDICWDVPLDYPLGALSYYFEIETKDGRRGTWTPPSLIDASRGIDSRPRILPEDTSLKVGA